jgi:hypothetical protein
VGRHDWLVEAPRFDLTLDTIAFRLTGGFEVAPALYIDGGVRRFAVNMTASVPTSIRRPGSRGSGNLSWARPSVPSSAGIFDSSPRRTSASLPTTRIEASRRIASVEWKPLSHLSLGGGWGWMYVRADGTILTDKGVHFSQTLNGPLLTIGVPF